MPPQPITTTHTCYPFDALVYTTFEDLDALLLAAREEVTRVVGHQLSASEARGMPYTLHALKVEWDYNYDNDRTIGIRYNVTRQETQAEADRRERAERKDAERREREAADRLAKHARKAEQERALYERLRAKYEPTEPLEP
jgi:CRISPR/Cas system CSM-associated protein Csm5 (group 7 of RAMP superfamily)